jgi:hypothetical protein
MATVSDHGGNGGAASCPHTLCGAGLTPCVDGDTAITKGGRGQWDDVGEGGLDGDGVGTVDGVREGAVDGVWGSASHGWPLRRGSCSHGRQL